MEQTIQLQFLDLDEVDQNDQEYVKFILYSVRSSRLTLPWVEPEEVQQQWPQQQYGSVCTGQAACYSITYHQDGEPEMPIIEASAVPSATNEVYHQVPVPVQTTMHQIYHHQVVSPMHNLPPYVRNIGPPPAPPNIGYPMPFVYNDRGRRPRSKPSPKRPEIRDTPAYPPTPVQYPPAYSIHHVPMATGPYPTYLPQGPPHMPSAQHATGHPLYLPPPPPMSMYPAPIYPTYQPAVYSHVHHEDYGKEHPPLEEKTDIEETEKPVEKPSSFPINAIKTTAPPTAPVKKQPRPPTTPTTSVTPTIVTVTQTTSPLPTVTPVTVAPVVADEKVPESAERTWAALFKPKEPVETETVLKESVLLKERKPPMYAVAVDRLEPNLKPSPRSQSTSVRPNQNPDEDPVLRNLGERLSTYQLEHKALVLTPRGLTNPSNYCYINATLQALLACPAFYNLIKVIAQVKEAADGPPPGATTPKTKTPIIDSMVQFIKEFSPAPVNRSGRREKQIWKDKEELDIPVGAPFEPTYVYKMLHALRNENAFQVEGRQEDAEEFLSLLLNGLNDEMLELVKLVDDPNKETPIVNGDVTANGDSHNDNNSDWKEVYKGVKSGRVTRRTEMGKTPLSEIFRGQICSKLQRPDEESTQNVQPFFTLQLDIEFADSVTEALDKYFGGRDQVEGAGGEMQHSLEELPNVLILHLKCFHYRQQSCLKISKSLEFPVDLKIDSKHISGKNKNNGKMRQYKLFAVVYHDGKEASKGHYLADAYHVGSGGWVRYDDAQVRAVNEATLLKPRPPRVPYLLYYRRADNIGQHSQLPR